MKKTKITFLVASLLCLGMGVGSALALNYSSANKHHEGAVDEAIYLYWGSGNSSLSIENVADLVAGTKQYRYFACEPSASASVAGSVTVTYTIAGTTAEEKTYTLEGLTVNVYATPTLQNDENRDLEGLVPQATLEYDVTESRTGTTQFNVGGTNSGVAYYCLEFIYDGSMATGDAWGGLMTISQAFNAA